MTLKAEGEAIFDDGHTYVDQASQSSQTDWKHSKVISRVRQTNFVENSNDIEITFSLSVDLVNGYAFKNQTIDSVEIVGLPTMPTDILFVDKSEQVQQNVAKTSYMELNFETKTVTVKRLGITLDTFIGTSDSQIDLFTLTAPRTQIG